MMYFTKEWLEKETDNFYVELDSIYLKKVRNSEEIKDLITTYLYEAFKRGQESGWIEFLEECNCEDKI